MRLGILPILMVTDLGTGQPGVGDHAIFNRMAQVNISSHDFGILSLSCGRRFF
jgi:hypothetical protein